MIDNASDAPTGDGDEQKAPIPRRPRRNASKPESDAERIQPVRALPAEGPGHLPVPGDDVLPALRPASENLLPAVEAPPPPASMETKNEDRTARKTSRRRPRRGGRTRRRSAAASETSAAPEAEAQAFLSAETGALSETSSEVAAAETKEKADATPDEPAAAPTPPKNRSRRSRRSRSQAAAVAPEADVDAAPPSAPDAEAPPALSSETAQADSGRKQRSGEAVEPAKTAVKKNDRKMLISVIPGDLVEVVLTEKGRVLEYYVEMVHHAKIRGNIYKGVVNNIDANLQAAFINYGNAKNGFLQIDEVHPEYWLIHHDASKGHKYPPIQKAMKPGQEVLVQVVKEPTGNKGAFLTTWISLAGRFLVLMPGQEQIGISRKVEDGEERNRLRDLIKGIDPGPGLGAIVRTVSVGTSKTTLQKDLNFLKRVWKDIRKRATTEKAPCQIYQEPGLASRAVRDYLSEDVTEIWVDDAETAEAIREMTSLLYPRKADFVHLHQETRPLWDRFNIRKQLEQVHSREVLLPSGGRLVFDQTEALMAVDINSGKIGGKTNFEAMAHRTNMEAAESIALQLRLRDVGGQIVIDFIEMHDPEHCREVEKTLRLAMKGDRARHDIGKMSSFGLLQIVRQRTGTSAISISTEPCPHCQGTGVRRNMEWQALQALRELERRMRAAAAEGKTEYAQAMEPEAALYLLNHKRERLCCLEKTLGVRLDIRIEGADH